MLPKRTRKRDRATEAHLSRKDMPLPFCGAKPTPPPALITYRLTARPHQVTCPDCQSLMRHELQDLREKAAQPTEDSTPGEGEPW